MLKNVKAVALAICVVSCPATAMANDGNGGTAPHLTLRHGDPAGFLVKPSPSPLTKTTAETIGDPIKFTIRNGAEGYRLSAQNPLPSSWVGPYKLHIESVTGEIGRAHV